MLKKFIFIFIILFANISIADDTKNTNSIKEKIYNLVKIQYYKDFQNSNSKNYYSTKKGSLAACLNWETLTDFFKNNQTKYHKKILWGSSYSNTSSNLKAIQNCKRRSINKKNCTCQVIDNNNENVVVIPEVILKNIGVTNSNYEVSNNDNEKNKKLEKLKKLYEDKLISQEEYTIKKNEILGIQNNNSDFSNAKSKDVLGPEINIPKTFEANENLLATIEGSVSDESEIALVMIDNDQILLKNNKFSHQLFVKPSGQTVLITAMDKYGNQTKTTVELKRKNIIIRQKDYAYLNPTVIKSKIKPSAVALIIGIEDYENTFSAPYAKNDALAFNDFVHFSMGVPRQNIRLLTNEEAGRTETLKIIAKWLPKIIKEDISDVYIFFSGHGLASENGEELYLLPSDGDPELLEDSTLLRNNIFKKIAKLKPKSVTVFLDTCYSGSTRTNEFLVAAKPIFIEVEEQKIPSNFNVFTASAGKETAKVLKEAEHGLFSYYMMKGLEGEADSNNDNQITNGELIAFINKNVSRQANQTPQLNGDPDKILVKW